MANMDASGDGGRAAKKHPNVLIKQARKTERKIRPVPPPPPIAPATPAAAPQPAQLAQPAPPTAQPVVVVADPATISNGHVVLNGVKREHEHEVVMTLAGLFKEPVKKRERTDNDDEEEEAEMNNGIKAEPPEDKENHQADDRVGELRQSFEMEVDRAEDSFVAHHEPASVAKVGIKLEDMGMGGNKRTVFYNKNKKLVEIQASLTKNGYCFTPSTRLTVTPAASQPGDYICLSIRQTHPAERDKRIEACSAHRTPDIALPAAFTVLPSAGVRVTWHEMGPEQNEAIAAKITLAPGVASVELSFPCPSSDQHNKGNIEAVRQGWQMQIGGVIGGARLCKDIPIQVMRKVRPFACKRIRNYAASSTSSIEDSGSPDRTLEEASRIEEEEMNRSNDLKRQKLLAEATRLFSGMSNEDIERSLAGVKAFMNL